MQLCRMKQIAQADLRCLEYIPNTFQRELRQLGHVRPLSRMFRSLTRGSQTQDLIRVSLKILNLEAGLDMFVRMNSRSIECFSGTSVTMTSTTLPPVMTFTFSSTLVSAVILANRIISCAKKLEQVFGHESTTCDSICLERRNCRDAIDFRNTYFHQNYSHQHVDKRRDHDTQSW